LPPTYQRTPLQRANIRSHLLIQHIVIQHLIARFEQQVDAFAHAWHPRTDLASGETVDHHLRTPLCMYFFFTSVLTCPALSSHGLLSLPGHCGLTPSERLHVAPPIRTGNACSVL
jgi:hypothetical protein